MSMVTPATSKTERARDKTMCQIVNDTNHFKLVKAVRLSECALLSESVLAHDWLTPEEDDAWKHL
jgi:hypothetical protein